MLAWVPDIEITSFKPLGFDIKEGGELSIWGILASVLAYYAGRSCYEYWTDYTAWIDTYRALLVIRAREYAGEELDRPAYARHARRLRMKFWVWDVTPPALLFLLALLAAFQQVAPLIWPPP